MVIGEDILVTLRQWVEALRNETIAKTTVEDIALINGRCVSQDIEDAIQEIERLREIENEYNDALSAAEDRRFD